MTDKLNDNDRKRIEQEAKDRLDEYENRKRFIQGAEYATIYEREQQAKEKFMQVYSASFSYGHKLVPSKVSYRLLTEQMAQRNHSQSLDRLNERGGMSVQEILDNIHSRNLQHGPQTQQHVDELNKLINELEAERSELYKRMELKEEEQRNELKEWKEAYRNELRNKVIEEIDKYYQENVFTLPTIDAEQCILALKAAYQFILSLKTK